MTGSIVLYTKYWAEYPVHNKCSMHSTYAAWIIVFYYHWRTTTPVLIPKEHDCSTFQTLIMPDNSAADSTCPQNVILHFLIHSICFPGTMHMLLHCVHGWYWVVFCGQSLSESSTWFILNRRNHLAVEASSHSRLQGSQKGVDHKQYSKVLQAYPSQTVLKQAYPRFSLLLKLKLLSFFTNIQSLVLQVRFWGTEGPTGFMNS